MCRHADAARIRVTTLRRRNNGNGRDHNDLARSPLCFISYSTDQVPACRRARSNKSAITVAPFKVGSMPRQRYSCSWPRKVP